MIKEVIRKAKSADIALLLEGSYPFVVGGVSHWTHQIIQHFKQYKFAIIFLGSVPEDYPDSICYELPDNVVHFEVHYLFADGEESKYAAEQSAEDIISFRLLEDFIKKSDDGLVEQYNDLNFYIRSTIGKDYLSFYHSKKSWQFVVDNYVKYCTNPSFIEYFWTTMHMQKPLWILANLVEDFIDVKVVHTISTGYAGLYGALIKDKYNYPLILTEHGIYSEERRIELLQSDVIQELDIAQRFATEMSYLRNLWIRFFDLLALICYRAANPVTSLYMMAKHKQIENGAAEDRLKVIPNGIDVAKFALLREKRDKKIPPVLCLISRIVPIKDIKTFIRAINIIVHQIPDVQGWVIGPASEDPGYLEECRNLVSVLELQNHVKFFPGAHDIGDFLPKAGLNVLTSISESMPLIVLEGFAAGVPALTTNVGVCSELIFGGTEEDKKLGVAGNAVQIANPQKFADAAIELLQNEKKWFQAQKTAIARVEKFYDQDKMFDQYQQLYLQVLGKS